MRYQYDFCPWPPLDVFLCLPAAAALAEFQKRVVSMTHNNLISVEGGHATAKKKKKKVSFSYMDSVTKHVMVDLLFRSGVKVDLCPCC